MNRLTRFQTRRRRFRWKWIALVIAVLIPTIPTWMRTQTPLHQKNVFKPHRSKKTRTPNLMPHSQVPHIATSKDPILILQEILASANDNDPRLDSELIGLSAPQKATIRNLYSSIPPESRNQRGTLVYVLGRNVGSQEDLAFFKDVLLEKDCASLANCSAPSQIPSGSSSTGVDEITLNYPKLVALKSLESLLKQGVLESAQAMSLIQLAAESTNRVVQNLAEAILTQSFSADSEEQ